MIKERTAMIVACGEFGDKESLWVFDLFIEKCAEVVRALTHQGIRVVEGCSMYSASEIVAGRKMSKLPTEARIAKEKKVDVLWILYNGSDYHGCDSRGCGRVPFTEIVYNIRKSLLKSTAIFLTSVYSDYFDLKDEDREKLEKAGCVFVNSREEVEKVFSKD